MRQGCGVKVSCILLFQAQTLSLRGQNCSQAATGAGVLCDCGGEGAAQANGSAGALLASRLSAGTLDKVISTLPALRPRRHYTKLYSVAAPALCCSHKHLLCSSGCCACGSKGILDQAKALRSHN